MGDGKLGARMTCGSEGMTALVTMQGTYSPDTFHLAMTTEAKGGSQAGAGSVSMAATVDSKRAGACNGTEDRG